MTYPNNSNNIQFSNELYDEDNNYEKAYIEDDTLNKYCKEITYLLKKEFNKTSKQPTCINSMVLSYLIGTYNSSIYKYDVYNNVLLKTQYKKEKIYKQFLYNNGVIQHKIRTSSYDSWKTPTERNDTVYEHQLFLNRKKTTLLTDRKTNKVILRQQCNGKNDKSKYISCHNTYFENILFPNNMDDFKMKISMLKSMNDKLEITTQQTIDESVVFKLKYVNYSYIRTYKSIMDFGAIGKEQYFVNGEEVLCVYYTLHSVEYEIYEVLSGGTHGTYIDIDKENGKMLLSSKF